MAPQSGRSEDPETAPPPISDEELVSARGQTPLEPLIEKVRFIEHMIKILDDDIADVEHELWKDIQRAIEQHARGRDY